jgi:hypothetical protein
MLIFVPLWSHRTAVFVVPTAAYRWNVGIRRNINGHPDITEYHFGVGFVTVRPRHGDLDRPRIVWRIA